MTKERAAWLHINTWNGRTKHRITVLGEARDGTAYRVRWEEETTLTGRNCKEKGGIYFPPKSAVSFEEEA